jgi:hypothetical protein
MFGFLCGAAAGALAVTYWRADLDTFQRDRLPGLRRQAADKLEAAERALVGRLDGVSATAASILRGTHTRSITAKRGSRAETSAPRD